MATIKNGLVYNIWGKTIYCGCTGNTEKTATPMRYEKGEIYCPNCHEKKVEIIQTYTEWKQEKDEKERKENEERLKNLHLTEIGKDWECGFTYYGLSANIDYNDWLKVKKYFKYHQKGWSKGQELEWVYGEPTGWLTRNPTEVETILLNEGLIKPENTLIKIKEREILEKQKKEDERKEQLAKREKINEEIELIDEQIRELISSDENKRGLSDAEARSIHYNSTYFRGTIRCFTVKDNEIIETNHMGDFITGVAVPYSEELLNLIKELHRLNNGFWKLMK